MVQAAREDSDGAARTADRGRGCPSTARRRRRPAAYDGKPSAASIIVAR